MAPRSSRTKHICAYLCIIAVMTWILVRWARNNASEVPSVFRDASLAECHWNFVEYRSSAWESDWITHLEERKMKVCPTMATNHTELAHCAQWILAVLALNDIENQMPADSALVLFSELEYELQCRSEQSSALSGTKMRILVEPLVGTGRDPFTICNFGREVPELLSNRQGWDYVQSKRHLLLSPNAPVSLRFADSNTWTSWSLMSQAELPNPLLLAARQNRRILLFDLGSALYSSWKGAANAGSTKYFVDQLQLHHNIQFTAIYAFEADAYKPFDAWSAVPEEILPFYHFINVPVSTKGRFNPLNWVKEIASPEDYVIVKLDIDTPAIENELIRQLMHDDVLLSLIDEMTYEHHVDVPEMRRWWGKNITGLTLSDTYRDFLFLRNHGIRMHVWP